MLQRPSRTSDVPPSSTQSLLEWHWRFCDGPTPTVLRTTAVNDYTKTSNSSSHTDQEQDHLTLVGIAAEYLGRPMLTSNSTIRFFVVCLPVGIVFTISWFPCIYWFAEKSRKTFTYKIYLFYRNTADRVVGRGRRTAPYRITNLYYTFPPKQGLPGTAARSFAKVASTSSTFVN